MKEDVWSGRVLAAFSASAARYDAAAGLQRSVAWRLAGICHRQAIPRGVWVDLGSGTGRLADDLEHLHPGQSVLRVDGSAAMLSRHGPTANTRLLDLNQALPKSMPTPTLLCSSFVLHWLEAPAETLQHWFQQLDDGGWLALAAIGQRRWADRAARDRALAEWENEYAGHPAARSVLPERFDYDSTMVVSQPAEPGEQAGPADLGPAPEPPPRKSANRQSPAASPARPATPGRALPGRGGGRADTVGIVAIDSRRL